MILLATIRKAQSNKFAYGPVIRAEAHDGNTNIVSRRWLQVNRMQGSDVTVVLKNKPIKLHCSVSSTYLTDGAELLMSRGYLTKLEALGDSDHSSPVQRLPQLQSSNIGNCEPTDSFIETGYETPPLFVQAQQLYLDERVDHSIWNRPVKAPEVILQSVYSGNPEFSVTDSAIECDAGNLETAFLSTYEQVINPY